MMYLRGEEVVDFGFTKTKRRISLTKNKPNISKYKKEIIKEQNECTPPSQKK